MPPKQPIPSAASPSPPPMTVTNEAQDMLVIQDLMDTLDQLPPELTRVYSDLNELGAVLYTTLLQLQSKLNQLIDWVQDPRIGPEQRFQLLQEIAEEAARYKLGADDKVRVAGGASEGIMGHQRHITNLLNASTLLNSAPPSPYTQALTLSQLPLPANTRRGQLSRAANSPFGGRGYAAAAGGASDERGTKVGDTPTKKKKSRVQQLGREEDEMSAGGKDKKVASKKRKTTNRGVSPTDSLGSASQFAGSKPVEPRTARQIAAAAASRARQMQRGGDDDSDDSEPARKPAGGVGMQITPSSDSMALDRGLGIDFGAAGGHSRESTTGRASAQATPTIAHAQVAGTKESGRSRQRSGNGNGSGAAGSKRQREEMEDEGESELDEEDRPKKGNGAAGSGAASAGGAGAGGKQGAAVPDGELGEGGDPDLEVYCVCRQVGYGEMIGCDEDTCEIEWYHVACLGFDKPPEGNWICPQCVERKKKNPKAKKGAKPRRTK